MRECVLCGETKPLTDFYKHAKSTGGRLQRCKTCVVARYNGAVQARARIDREYYQRIKVERGCADCGYNANPVALDFDHLPGTVKKYRVCTMAGMKRENIDAEIAKCEVVCANCHRIRTNDRLREQGKGEEILTGNGVPTPILTEIVPD